MRPIDADVLIDDIKNHLWDWETVDGITGSTVLRQTISDIENQPTVNPTIARLLEIKELPTTETVWVENRGKTKVYVAIPDIDVYAPGWDFVCKYGTVIQMPLWYGHKWRAWTAMPTDEQRKEVAWE